MNIKKYIQDLQIDDADVCYVSLVLNEYDTKDNLIGTNAYKEIAKILEIKIDLDSHIFNEIERFIVYKFYEMVHTNDRFKTKLTNNATPREQKRVKNRKIIK
jgi:hypothetical protein